MATETSVEIADEGLAGEARPLVEQLTADAVASKLAAGDATLWGPEAESEASIRLSWTTLDESSRPLISEIESLRAELQAEGLDRIVLAGMGGSSLAPEVITATAGVRLTVLDTTDPAQVADALSGDLDRTVLVVSSKSGTTVETDSHRRIFEAAFSANGIDPATRIVVVTDPESPMEAAAHAAGYRRVFTADPHVGGRYSALTAFGLVPAGLALLPESRDPAPGPWDLLGVAWSLVGMIGTVYAVKEAAVHGLRADVVVAAVVGVTALALFVRRQSRSRHPLVDVRLFCDRAFSGVIGATLLAVLGLSGLLYFLSQFFQLVQGYSPLQAGVAEVPAVIGSVLL